MWILNSRTCFKMSLYFYIREKYKGINKFKKGYKLHVYVIKKKHHGIIVADTTSILSRWEQFFSNLLNANHSTTHNRREIYTAEPDILEPSLVEFAIENLNKHEVSGVDHIQSELIQAGGGKLYEEINLKNLF